MKETLQKRDKIIDIIVFIVLILAVTAVTLRLFYLQTISDGVTYHSDMKAYILEMLGQQEKYDFPYPVFFKFAAFIHLFSGPEMAVAAATALLNSLSIVITKAAFNHLVLKQLGDRFHKNKWIAGILLSLLAVSLYFISMVFPPEGIWLPGIRYRYLGVFTSNPFHNATYMAARPFAILAFLWFAKLLPVYEKGYGGSWKNNDKGIGLSDYILFAVFLLTATMTKPSFTIVLVGTAGLIMLYRLIKSKFRGFVPAMQLGLCFVPTFVDLLYQYRGVFVPDAGQEGGIGFGFASVWKLYCDNIPLAIGLAVGFPILVVLLNYKELKADTTFRFSCQIYLMSLAMALILYEKGFRMPDFNFSWGYMYGIFFAFFGALLVLIRATASGKGKKFLLTIQWLAYGWHVICGVYYFWGIFRGNMYY